MDKQHLSKPQYDVHTLNSIPISDVISRFDTLRRKGSQQIAHCVWHEDHNPSLYLKESGKDNYCKCFACGKKASVIDYVMQVQGWNFLQACEWLSDVFHCGKMEHDGCGNKSFHSKQMVAKRNVEPKQVEYSYIPKAFLDSIVSSDNSFCKCMKQVFDPYLVEHITEEYRLGTYAYYGYDDDVAFPSIDIEGRIHNIKVQHYCTDIHSPDFFHCDRKHCYWIGKSITEQCSLPKNAHFDNYCLFGAHLLRQHPRATVILVESPKNALVGAAAYPEYLWLATGSKDMIKESVLSCLHNRSVIVYPDKDAITEWTLGLEQLKHITAFQISHFAESHGSAEEQKYDIADYILTRKLSDLKM